MKNRYILFVLLVSIFVLATNSASELAGNIFEISGRIEVKSLTATNRSPENSALWNYKILNAGDCIKCDKGSFVEILFSDGTKKRMTNSVWETLPMSPPSPTRSTNQAWRGFTYLSRTRAPSAFCLLLTPQPGEAIQLSESFRFSWRVPPNETLLTFECRNADGVVWRLQSISSASQEFRADDLLVALKANQAAGISDFEITVESSNVIRCRQPFRILAETGARTLARGIEKIDLLPEAEMRCLTRISLFHSRQLFSPMINEFEKGLLMPKLANSIDFLEVAEAELREAGYLERANTLKQKLDNLEGVNSEH